MKTITTLRKNRHLKEHTPLIAKTLLEGHDLERLTFYDLNMSAKNAETISYQYGSADLTTLHQAKAIHFMISSDVYGLIWEIKASQDQITSYLPARSLGHSLLK